MENNKRRPASQGPRDSSITKQSRQLIGRQRNYRRLSTIARNRVREINETRPEEDTRLGVPERLRLCARFAEDSVAYQRGRAVHTVYTYVLDTAQRSDFTIDNFLC